MTPKQERFVQEYPKDSNAKAAAIRAGYSPKTAEQIGWQLLQKTSVAEAIQSKTVAIAEKVDWDATKVLIRLGEQADADILDIQDEHGNLKPLKEWPAIWRKMIQGMEVEQKSVRSKDGVQAGESKSWDKTGDRILKIKFVDRLKNLELLGRHKAVDAFVKQSEEKHEHLHLHVSVEDRLSQARQIAAQQPQDVVSGSTIIEQRKVSR